jgi:hypothetical protein
LADSNIAWMGSGVTKTWRKRPCFRSRLDTGSSLYMGAADFSVSTAPTGLRAEPRTTWPRRTYNMKLWDSREKCIEPGEQARASYVDIVARSLKKIEGERRERDPKNLGRVEADIPT